KAAATKIEKLLDESNLSLEQKRMAIRMAAKELGIPLSLTIGKDEGELTIPSEKFTVTDAAGIDAPIRKEGSIEFTHDNIPSVTGGRSPAMDFVHALNTGNPEAERLIREQIGDERIDAVSLGRHAKEQSLADVFMASTYNWTRYFNYNAKQEKRVLPILNHY